MRAWLFCLHPTHGSSHVGCRRPFSGLPEALEPNSSSYCTARSIITAICYQDLHPTDEHETYLGIHADSDISNPVFCAWSQILRADLITPEELSTALYLGTVRDVFVAAIVAGAAGNPPLWQPMNYCRHLVPKLGTIPAVFQRLVVRQCSAVQSDPNPFAPGISHMAAERAKEAGNEHLRSRRYREALASYEHAIEEWTDDDVPKSSWELASIVHSNVAQVHIVLEEWSAARRAAKKAVWLNPSNEKAIFRKKLAEEKLMSCLGEMEQESRAA